MSDDGFFREVEEELRSDRLKRFWDRYGLIIIAVAVLAVALTAGYRGWEWYSARQASASGDRFLEALNLANEGNNEQALARLEALQADGHGQYPVLARMRAATVHHEAGNVDAAVEAFDTIADDRSVPGALRDLSRLRAAYILVDHGDYGQVAARAEQLTAPENPLRHSAREAIGLAAYNAERYGDAKRLFDEIVADELSPPGLANRARIMLELIDAKGAVAEG
ncbi:MULTISPECIES: tetratricopeptide repeat protein [unclassified Roseitalea]|uniref:tetratricopeptide repeat protein n=1 Tax=unclassified Roseitalea TaxID=2639107 RepID=UPI00274021F7|nr:MULTISPECIES: tetratricopeptide repeat protein [unclassified Roseitalea]